MRSDNSALALVAFRIGAVIRSSAERNKENGGGSRTTLSKMERSGILDNNLYTNLFIFCLK
jgi:hypothetical protein